MFIERPELLTAIRSEVPIIGLAVVGGVGHYDYADALAAAHELDAHEALLVRDDGLVTEGSWTSVFVERDGKLVTPPLTLGLLPGVLRDSLVAQGRAVEGEVTLDDLTNGFFIGNALRGLMRARLI